jgi:hypothetical protein
MLKDSVFDMKHMLRFSLDVLFGIFLTPINILRSWLRHWATSRKVAGSIPNGVTGIFRWLNPSGLHGGPGVPGVPPGIREGGGGLNTARAECWLICDWVRDLTVPMHRGPLCPISIYGSPVALLKFQMSVGLATLSTSDNFINFWQLLSTSGNFINFMRRSSKTSGSLWHLQP